VSPIVFVVAMAENGVIGDRGKIPWRIADDMKHFKALTIGKPCVMGRKTWDSLPRKPLLGRTNIVLTRDLSVKVPGGALATSLDAALGYARDDARKRGVDEIMVIGGSDVFADTLPLAHRLEITHVHAAPEGDAYFPPIDPAVWREVVRREYPAGPDDSASFAVAAYLRH